MTADLQRQLETWPALVSPDGTRFYKTEAIEPLALAALARIRELEAELEGTVDRLEHFEAIANQISTDWIPANKQLAERLAAAEARAAAMQGDAERYRVGFVMLLAYALRVGYFDGGDTRGRVVEFLTNAPLPDGVSVGQALYAAMGAKEE